MKPNLAISFSGGRTSAVMTKRLLESHGGTHDIFIVFANTGCEHPATLEFIHNCETVFGWAVVWVEAVVATEHGVGVSHRIVTYETASRQGEPFEAAVAKYGIFNQTAPACTARLKTDVIESFLKSHGWVRGKSPNYETAIGIRADEADRVSVNRKKHRIIYPLIGLGLTKADVIREVRTWPFDLNLPSEIYGNCVWCWKKTLRKHLTLCQQYPEAFNFPEKMEREYGHIKGDMKAAADDGRRYWFRGHRSVADLMQLSEETEFEPWVDKVVDLIGSKQLRFQFDDELDKGSGCGESCEIYSDLD